MIAIDCLRPAHLLVSCCVGTLSLFGSQVVAEVALPSILSDHMVLQRDLPLTIWGWADPQEAISVALAGQNATTQADDQGRWSVKLSPLAATQDPQTLTVKGKNEINVKDVLVGEVWVCSGQSNMEWPVTETWNADLTIAAAKHPQIRLVTVANAGVQVPIHDFSGSWQICTPDTVKSFSAVGYHFGLVLQQLLDVPIGLIDNSWGGSSCEAWIQRDRFADQDALYGPLLQRWVMSESEAEPKAAYESYEAALLKWQSDVIAAKKSGQPLPDQPARPNTPLVAQHRPGNLFNGRVEPILPFAIRGAIWYQGESNASRAYQYRHMFPLMIRNWREAWDQGEFPFYWVQLADFKQEVAEPGDSDWAELREAQTMAVRELNQSGQAVIIDLGEGSDIHPREKAEVARRLARLALAQNYGWNIVHRSPQFSSMEIQEGKAILSFEHRGGGLRTVDERDVLGFAIAGEDRKWRAAQAKILDGEKVVVWHDELPQPVAVRYAWADNPVCNLFNAEGLPVTPFRTDDWPGVTAEAR
jgi:sialate O-acetylesterase